jgi:hypothetical protein
MQVKELISWSEILHAAPHYSLVIPAEVYITMPDVVLYLYPLPLIIRVSGLMSHQEDRMKHHRGGKG